MSRENFNRSWLTEMPQGLGQFETFDTLEYHIHDFAFATYFYAD